MVERWRSRSVFSTATVLDKVDILVSLRSCSVFSAATLLERVRISAFRSPCNKVLSINAQRMSEADAV